MPREPSTWSTRDRAAYHRIDAARLREMAAAATCSAAREVLVNLARHYRRVASKIEKRAVASAGHAAPNHHATSTPVLLRQVIPAGH